jgi:hypothetical protein
MNVLPNRNIFRNHFSTLTVILCVLALFAPIAGAAVVPGNTLPLYMVHHNDNNIDTLDPLTGQAITTVPITLAGVGVTGGFWGLDQQPGTGTLFAIWKRTELVTINPTTGAMVDIGPIGHNVGGITFATIGSTPTLYMVTGASDETNPDTLYTLNTSTGAATLVLAFATGNNLGETIAFNPFDGMLYRLYGSGTIGVNQFMVSVNPNTLAVTNIPLTGDTYNQATSLTHWAGKFLLMAGHDSNLYLVTTGGNVTNVSPLNAGDGDTKGLVFTGAPAPCSPLALLYGAANSSSGEADFLYSINPTNGTPTLIGPMGFGEVGGIRFNAGGTLFGTGETGDGIYKLFTINACTGASTLVGSAQLSSIEFSAIVDISIRHSDGALFAYMRAEGPDGLATLNTTTGAATAVTTFDGSALGGAIAFSSAGTLFNAFGTNLETINLSTNNAMTLVAALSFPNFFEANPSFISAMDFQPGTGTLFGAATTAINGPEEIAPAHAPIRNGGPPIVPANYLVTISTTSGAVSSVGETELGMSSIAFSPAVALPPASITATGGTPQSAVIEAEFAMPLQATVKDSNSNPVAGVTVTFTAPATGATAFFQGGANTAVTNASGVATSVSLFAGDTAGGPYNVVAAVVGVETPANFALTNTVGQPEQIILKSGTPQTATVTTAFALPLSVTVEDGGGNPVPGVTITFTPPSTGASGTFAGGNTAVSNSSGIATSGTFTANGTSGGPYNVLAALPEEGSPEFRAATAHPQGFSTQVTFSLKNVDYSVTPTTTTQTVAPGATANYSLTFTAIVGNSVNPTTFSCTGLPSLSACTFTPTSLPANSPTTPFTLAISTTAPGTATNVGPANKLVGPFTRVMRPGVLALLAMLALMLTAFAIPNRRFARLRVSAVGVFGFAALLLLTSCISGCGSTGTGFPIGNNNPGTPAGTYTVTVVGTSGAVQRTTTVTLVVQ